MRANVKSAVAKSLNWSSSEEVGGTCRNIEGNAFVGPWRGMAGTWPVGVLCHRLRTAVAAVLTEGVQLSSAFHSLFSVNSIARITSHSASLTRVSLFHLPLCSNYNFVYSTGRVGCNIDCVCGCVCVGVCVCVVCGGSVIHFSVRNVTKPCNLLWHIFYLSFALGIQIYPFVCTCG